MQVPLVIGHRGASAHAPENTIASFGLALEQGADGIEFDVRLSRDGRPVVIHDADLIRTGQRMGVVSELSADVICATGVGAWFNLKYPERARPEYERCLIPTLAEVFDLVRNQNAILYIELKCDEHDRKPIAEGVLSMIEAYGFEDRSIIESFDLETIRLVKLANSKIRTAALFEPRIKRPILTAARIIQSASEYLADEVALHFSLLGTARRTSALRRGGFEIATWTVDSPIWIKRALTLGVGTLITNDPETMVRARNALAGRETARG